MSPTQALGVLSYIRSDSIDATGSDSNATNSHSLLKAFLTLQFTGGIGLLIVLVTVYLSHTVRRHATWFNFCWSWIISVISYTLLTFAGQQTGPEPNSELCLFQSALIYAAPVLTSCSIFALVIQLWSSLILSKAEEDRKPAAIRDVMLLVFPYVVWIVIFIESFILGLASPNKVQRAESSVYCINTTGLPGKVSAVLVLLVMVCTLVLEVLIAVRLHKNWRAFRGRENSARRFSLTTAIRVSIFSLLGALSIGVSLVFVSHISINRSNIFIALLPFAAFTILGTQADIMSVWIFCGRSTEPLQSPKSAELE